MDSSTDQKNIAKNITGSILAGIGYVILVFLLGIIMGIILLRTILSSFLYNETAGLGILISLFWIIALLSVVAGIMRGIRTYKSLSEKK